MVQDYKSVLNDNWNKNSETKRKLIWEKVQRVDIKNDILEMLISIESYFLLRKILDAFNTDFNTDVGYIKFCPSSR